MNFRTMLNVVLKAQECPDSLTQNLHRGLRRRNKSLIAVQKFST